MREFYLQSPLASHVDNIHITIAGNSVFLNENAPQLLFHHITFSSRNSEQKENQVE